MKYCSAVILCFTGIFLSAGQFELAPGKETVLNIPASDSSRILRIRARLNLPEGREAWGGYFLGMTLNGKELPLPVNTGILWNIAKVPPVSAPQYSEGKKAWFVKADSNWIAFDCEIPGNAFRRTAYLAWKNIRGDRSGYTNAYYDKVFRLDERENALSLKNCSERYTMICDIATAPLHGDLLFSQPAAGKSILPWSFPECSEVRGVLKLRVCAGEREPAMLALRNLGKNDVAFSWNLADFRAVSGAVIPASAADIRVQEYYKVKDGSATLQYAGLDGHVLRIPDRLTAQKIWRVKKNESGALWLLLTAPENAAPGIYRSELVLNGICRIPVELEILPFKLARSPRIYGLWTNSLPGRDGKKRKQQVQDLQKHGISNILLDAWTVPVPLAKDGTPDTRHFDRALAWLKEEGLNRQVLIYGLLGPLLRDIGKVAGTNDYTAPEFQKILIPAFETLALHAERQGFQIYFHCTDEPDIHPDTVPAFEKFCRMLRNRTALKIASNATPAGVRKWEGLLDLNLSAAYNGVIDGWLGKGYVNPFYRQWGECPPEYIREHCRYSYVQVRSRNPLSARADFGFYCDAMNLKGMWGFAYYWDSSDWYIAWPFPENDGRYGTTVGWEMLHAGIQDSRCLHTLHELAARKGETVQFKLPAMPELMRMEAEELAALRNEIIEEILNLSHNDKEKQ